MSSSYYRQLYTVAPGFKVDRDEEWMHYLEPREQFELRRQRGEFLAKNEQLDDLKVALRDAKDPTQVKTLSEKISSLTIGINRDIVQLLRTIPKLKLKAENARSDAVLGDFENSNKRARLDKDDDEMNVFDDEYSDFMPQNLRTKPPSANPESKSAERSAIIKPEASPSPRKQTNVPASLQSNQSDSSQVEFQRRDTYLDGINNARDKSILTKLRPLIEQYDCRNRVVQALKQMRNQAETKDALQLLKTFVGSQNQSPKN